MRTGIAGASELGGRHIELDEGVDELDGEVFLRSVGTTPRPPDVLEVIASMPVGTRSKGDIDNQLAEDRGGAEQAWERSADELRTVRAAQALVEGVKGECAAPSCRFQDEIVGEIRGACFEGGKR